MKKVYDVTAYLIFSDTRQFILAVGLLEPASFPLLDLESIKRMPPTSTSILPNIFSGKLIISHVWDAACMTFVESIPPGFAASLFKSIK